jgi:type II secretory pathway pseudopilin PulG
MADRDTSNTRITRIEIAIVAMILIAMAGLFGPQLTNAANQRRENVLADQLHYLRTQILIYRAQHGGIAPGYAGGDMSTQPTADMFVKQMTGYTDQHGAVADRFDETHLYGPYIQEVPANPFNGDRSIVIIGDDEPFPQQPLPQGGWLYKPSTCALAANVRGHDANGVSLIDY